MKLFTEFQSTSAQQWEEQIIKELKLSSLEELFWHTPEDIQIRPFYNQEHSTHQSISPLFFNNQFEIVQYLPTYHHSEKEINDYLIKSLNAGATGIHLEFYEYNNFSEIFNNISLEHIYSNIHISFDAINLLQIFKDIYVLRNKYTQRKNFFINIDPIFLYEKYGEWHQNQQSDFQILYELNHIPVNALLYKECGANTVQEIAYAIAHLNEYLYYLDSKNKLSQYKDIHFNVAVGNSFFTEVAKIRALRTLSKLLLNEYKHTASIHIHAQTTLINKTYLDIYNNLIRTTTEATSAIFGGADSISILPFDYPFNKISDFSLRMARNQLIIMKEESYLDKTSDVSFGSFYVENYTKSLAEKAYQKFIEIEKQNGLVALLEKNIIQTEIQQSFEQQQKKYITNQEILVGVNKYPNPKQEKKETFFYTDKKNMGSNSYSLKPVRYAEYFENQIQKT